MWLVNYLVNTRDFFDYLKENATEIRESGTAENTTTTVYTSTGNLYVDVLTIDIDKRNTTAGTAEVQLWNGTAIDCRVWRHYSNNEIFLIDSVSFPSLLLLPNTWAVRVYSSAANIWAHCFVHGWQL